MVEEYLGAVKLFAGNFAIRGYAFCAGQLLSIQQNTALFSILGTTYGGNGVNNFQLPDLRGRLPIGQGNGQGLSPRVIGEVGGVENVSLLSNNVPPHNHLFNASTTPTTTGTASPTVTPGGLKTADGTFYTAPGQTNLNLVALNPGAVKAQGGNLPHNNIQPSMGINYIIALNGVFPSRN
ncbi:MAG TPA: tail fiber protein [Chloroflexota bacterium]|jgi:microcystin-dependent protein|nr:tail fiber protein [Chloroflexota bacterium]